MGLSFPFHKWGKRGTREQLAGGGKTSPWQSPGNRQDVKHPWKTKSWVRGQGEALRQLQLPYAILEKPQHDCMTHLPLHADLYAAAALSHQCPIQSQTTILNAVPFRGTFARHGMAPMTVAHVSSHTWVGRISHPFRNPSFSLLCRDAGEGKWICDCFSGSAGRQSCS